MANFLLNKVKEKLTFEQIQSYKQFLTQDRCGQDLEFKHISICYQLSGFPWQTLKTNNPFDEKYSGQKWGWNPLVVKGSGRFGGGWAFKFGITSNENFRELVIDLGIGSVRLEIMPNRGSYKA